jgi:hypothetical protein
MKAVIPHPRQFENQCVYTEEALRDTYKCRKCGAKIDPQDAEYYGRLCRLCYSPQCS